MLKTKTQVAVHNSTVTLAFEKIVCVPEASNTSTCGGGGDLSQYEVGLGNIAWASTKD